jgi:hypothetical protein
LVRKEVNNKMMCPGPSREFGMVSEDNMIGRVVAVVNPGYSVTGFVVNSEEGVYFAHAL